MSWLGDFRDALFNSDLPPAPGEDRPAGIREDAREYVFNGDTVWGDSITWLRKPGAVERGDLTVAEVVGWCLPRPREGDVLLVLMAGGWGRWVFAKPEYKNNVENGDMFFATVRGVVDYLCDCEAAPLGKRATERLTSLSEFVV